MLTSALYYLSLPLTKRKKQLQVVTARSLNQESGVTHWLYDLDKVTLRGKDLSLLVDQLCAQHWAMGLEYI